MMISTPSVCRSCSLSLRPALSLSVRRLLVLLVIGLIWGLGAAPSLAQVVYVAQGASGGGTVASPYGSLQEALADPFAEEIRVSEGTYYPAATDRAVSFELSDGVVVRGGYAPGFGTRDPGTYPTVLSGDIDRDGSPAGNAYRVLAARAGVTAATVIDGVTVTGGAATGSDADTGGGLFIEKASPTLRNVVFRNNEASFGGGAVFCSSGQPVFEDVVFAENRGRIIGAGGVLSVECGISVTRSTFDGNRAEAGAGLYLISGSATLNDVLFTANAANQGGGALYNSNGTLIITGGRFEANESTGIFGGGAIYDVGGTVRLSNVRFAGNTATRASGGAIEANETNLDITNAVFTANTSTDGRGGAVFLSDAFLTGTHWSTSGNSSADGSVLHASGFGSATLHHVVFWNEDAPVVDGGATVNIGAAFIDGGLPAAATRIAGSPAVLDVDPQFRDVNGPDDVLGTLDDDLRIGPRSPAVDRGIVSRLPADPDDLDDDGDTGEALPVDMDGSPRVQDSSIRETDNGGPDLGAYETSSTLVVRGTADAPAEDAAPGEDRGWRTMAVPATATVGDIADDIVFGAGGLSGTEPTAMIYRWDDAASNDTSTYASQFVGLTSLDDPLPAGRGFILYVFDDQIDPVRPGSPLVFDVPGAPPAADVTVRDLNPDALYHFLGNPFGRSFALDGLDIGTGSGFQAFVWVWDPAAQRYLRVEAGTSAGVVAPWQGFFLERSPESTTRQVTFDVDARDSGAEFVGKRTAPRMAATARIGLRLQALEEGQTVSTDDVLEVSFREDASHDWDVWDGVRPEPPSRVAPRPQVSFVGTRSGEPVRKAHECRPLSLQSPVRLPLRVDATPSSGALRLDVSSWQNIPSAWQVRLVDTQGTADPADDRSVPLRTDGDGLTVRNPGSKATATAASAAGSARRPQRMGGEEETKGSEAAAKTGQASAGHTPAFYLVVTPTAGEPRPWPLAARRTGDTVELRWTPQGARRPAEIRVEHSTDGETWSRVETAPDGGQRDGSSVRRVVDPLMPGRHLFRLQLRPGRSETRGPVGTPYSQVAEVTVPVTEASTVRPPAPNPVRDRSVIQVSVREPQQVRVRLFDLLGRRVGEVYRDRIEGGRTKQVVIDASRLGLSSGTYIVRITGDRFAETHRLSVIR